MTTKHANPVPRHAAASPWLPFAARIGQIQREQPDAATYVLEIQQPTIAAGYRFLPGQFNMIYLPGFGESAISISSNPRASTTISHTIKFVGNVTQAISRTQVGDTLLLRGPFGSAWPLGDCRGKDLIIASGGFGLAPLRPVLYEIMQCRSDFGTVSLLYGARTPSHLLYRTEYDDWRSAGIDVAVTVDFGDDTWQGNIGVVPQLLAGLRSSISRAVVFVCGPEIMMRFVVRDVLARQVAKSRIWLSVERNMNCAVGFCGHCQLGPEFVCKDGPVFSLERIEPYLNVADL